MTSGTMGNLYRLQMKWLMVCGHIFKITAKLIARHR